MSTEALKTCTSCGDDWPADAEFFYKQRGRSAGLLDTCKACCKERNRALDSRRQPSSLHAERITDALQGLMTRLVAQGEPA